MDSMADTFIINSSHNHSLYLALSHFHLHSYNYNGSHNHSRNHAHPEHGHSHSDNYDSRTESRVNECKSRKRSAFLTCIHYMGNREQSKQLLQAASSHSTEQIQLNFFRSSRCVTFASLLHRNPTFIFYMVFAGMIWGREIMIFLLHSSQKLNVMVRSHRHATPSRDGPVMSGPY